MMCMIPLKRHLGKTWKDVADLGEDFGEVFGETSVVISRADSVTDLMTESITKIIRDSIALVRIP